MQIFDDKPAVKAIYDRSLSLSISKILANEQNGNIYVVEKQDSEQTNRRRELLQVEEESNLNKIIEEHGQNKFKDQMMSQFFAKVNKEANIQFENKENLFNNTLHIEQAAPAILETLSVKAASLKRIVPLITSLPWLSDELIKLVNKPQYRKRADVQVTDPSLALSYIGLDNLKLVIPTFTLKHWLPATTAPFTVMKRKLWNDALSVALASSALAKAKGMDTFAAFSGGMLSNIGYLAVTKIFLKTYNDLYKKALREAYEGRDKRLHDILVEFDSSPELLQMQLSERSSIISAELVELMRFDRLQITEALFDIAQNTDMKSMCPLATIIIKAKAYVAFRNLVKEGLITNDEARLLLGTVNLSSEEITLLRKTDIDHIKLNFS